MSLPNNDIPREAPPKRVTVRELRFDLTRPASCFHLLIILSNMLELLATRLLGRAAMRSTGCDQIGGSQVRARNRRTRLGEAGGGGEQKKGTLRVKRGWGGKFGCISTIDRARKLCGATKGELKIRQVLHVKWERGEHEANGLGEPEYCEMKFEI
jgi:hypothetical protein